LIPTMARHIFQAFPVWIYTQSNITNIKRHIGPKTMVTLVYQMKTNQRPSLLATNLIVPC
jgi:hypothetical protein